MKENALLAGPFIGSLDWELYRFAPYINFLKKRKPSLKIIVLTFPERFDLYGQYANIFVPLKLEVDNISSVQNCLGIDNFDISIYRAITSFFFSKYSSRFKISSHLYPDIKGYRSKMKWQFPRQKMDYDFKPNKCNDKSTSNIKLDAFVDLSWLNSKSIRISVLEDIFKFIPNFIDYNSLDKKIKMEVGSTKLGCVISLIKKSNFVIGNLESPISHLAILLKKPLLSIGKIMTEDQIHLLNPLKTLVIQSNSIEEGIKKIDENFI